VSLAKSGLTVWTFQAAITRMPRVELDPEDGLFFDPALRRGDNIENVAAIAGGLLGPPLGASQSTRRSGHAASTVSTGTKRGTHVAWRSDRSCRKNSWRHGHTIEVTSNFHLLAAAPKNAAGATAPVSSTMN
jgi:hypothetical protein